MYTFGNEAVEGSCLVTWIVERLGFGSAAELLGVAIAYVEEDEEQLRKCRYLRSFANEKVVPDDSSYTGIVIAVHFQIL